MKKVCRMSSKVLFIVTVENYLLSFHIPFMKYFQDKSYEVHVSTKLGERREKLNKQGIACHNIDFSRSISPFTALISLKQLTKLMRENDFSLVHVNTPMAAFLGRLATKMTHMKPVLYTAHGFHFYRGAPWYYMTFIYLAEYVAGKLTDVSMETMEENTY